MQDQIIMRELLEMRKELGCIRSTVNDIQKDIERDRAAERSRLERIEEEQREMQAIFAAQKKYLFAGSVVVATLVATGSAATAAWTSRQSIYDFFAAFFGR